MVLYGRWLIAASTLLCIKYAISSTISHPITTLINAKWSQTPLYMEIAEYLSDQNVNLYWDFVDRLATLDTPMTEMETESKRYNTALRIVQDLLTPSHVSLMKLAISMHTLTPRIQAHLQIAKELLADTDCGAAAFIQIGNSVYCSLDELKQAIQIPNSMPVETFSFDHVYPGTENGSTCVILYSDMGSKEFQKYNAYIKANAVKFNIKYVARHYVTRTAKKKVGLSGYGVELHLKSTEYKSQDDSPQQSDDSVKSTIDEEESEVAGFDFKVLRERFPHLSHSLDRFKKALLEKSEEIEPLKAWEFQDLGLQAAQRIAEIQSDEALHILAFIAQNFPTQAKALLAQKVTDDFKNEMKQNIESIGRNLNLQPPDAALFVNGMYFDADTLDLVSLMDTLRTELDVLSGLYDIGLKGSITSNLLALDLSMSSQKEFAIDIRDTAINWINDLETDSQYRRWPSSVMDLLRPTFPGMMRNVRKNLFNLVLVIDPIETSARSLLRLAESFVVHLAPIRLGIVFDTRNETEKTKHNYRSVVCAFNYMMQNQSPRAALGLLTDVYSSVGQSKIATSDVKKELKKSVKSLSAKEIDSILGEDSEYDYGLQLAKDFIDRLGHAASPVALMNGVPLQESLLKADDFEEAVLTEIMQQTPALQKSVYKGELADSDSVLDYLMSQPHVMPRLNQRILSTDEPKMVDLSGKPRADIKNVNILMQLSVRDMTATVLDNLKYFTSQNGATEKDYRELHFMTLWVFGDLETESGRRLLQHALEYMKSNKDIRVAFIPNTEGLEVADKMNLNRLVWAASQSLLPNAGAVLVSKWLNNPGEEPLDIPDALSELLPSTELHIKMLRVYSQRVMNLKKSENMVVANGRCYGPLVDSEIFKLEDFNLLDRFHSHHYIDKIKRSMQQELDNEDSSITSDTVLKLITTLVPRQQSRSRFTIPTDLKDDHTAVKLSPKNLEMPHFYIVAIVDPASKSAQKLAPILTLLRQVINCDMKVYLCAVEQHSDMPVKSFYRFVIEPETKFTPDGKIADGPYARFIGLPASPILTQNLQVPENWLVEVVRSVYDLDNIKLLDIGGPVYSEYELEYLLLEGHCFDSSTGSPPRGLQITLGTSKQPTIVDTIVMANFGYFQLKANPGVWDLRLRQGKSADIFDISQADGTNTFHKENSTRVVISSLRSHVIKLRVTKKPNMMDADLLGDDSDSQSGIWDSITSSFGRSASAETSEVINIFSLASGHLYERLTRIMMLSLIKHTKSPVKFWFLKNYLSPQFIDFLPHMSKEYGFDFELVQYKWPRWLHQQTEKQRTIWGYKILFLDVLFPLDVKKIIFVDADAVVRADIKELNELDLNSSPYAYTPFCDSRKEMEGFRFWKQGYWRNHLMGRRYHISALYVVDLKRFRKIAAGDRLRGQYQALSQDPNSLSNLDQDLPNNMIHQVSIKSLPDEWLWCETWCSTESLKKAKVIDLCNNPMTKEAKLTAAQRIVPEWKEYDAEIKKLMAKVEDHEMEGDTSSAYGSRSEQHTKHSEL